jgi:hypothetical protein
MQVSNIYPYVVAFILVVLVVLFIISSIKGIIKLALIVIIGVVGLALFGKLTPVELRGTNEASLTQIINLAKTSSDKVKVNTSDGYSVSVKIADTWVSTADIADIKATGAGEYIVTINGKDIEVSDKTVCTVLSYVVDGKQ